MYHFVLKNSIDLKRMISIQISMKILRITFKIEEDEEDCTLLIPRGNSYCRRKSSARGPRFKVSSEGLSAEIDIPLRSPIQVQTKAYVA